MRLNVANFRAGIGREPLQRSYLVRDEIFKLLCIHMNGAASESPKIIEARMRPEPNATLLGEAREAMHDRGVAAMKTARHICGSHDAEQFLVMADFIGPEPFSHVGIEIDLHSCPHSA